jgi:hypothetical protein
VLVTVLAAPGTYFTRVAVVISAHGPGMLVYFRGSGPGFPVTKTAAVTAAARTTPARPIVRMARRFLRGPAAGIASSDIGAPSMRMARKVTVSPT